jgi:hypothetical protein
MFAINEKAVLLPEQVEVTVLGTVAGQALVKGETLGTMQVPFRRLRRLEEAEIKEICSLSQECAEISDATSPPPPETSTATEGPSEEPEPVESPAAAVKPDGIETLVNWQIPKRITKKWLSGQRVEVLQEIMEKAELTAARRKTIQQELDRRS